MGGVLHFAGYVVAHGTARELSDAFAQQMHLSLLLQEIINNINVLLLLCYLEGRQTVLVLNHKIRSSCYELLYNREMSEQGCSVEGGLAVLFKKKLKMTSS